MFSLMNLFRRSQKRTEFLEPLVQTAHKRCRCHHHRGGHRSVGVESPRGWLTPWDVRCMAIAGMRVNVISAIYGDDAAKWAEGR
jgi:hypothetical protein